MPVKSPLLREEEEWSFWSLGIVFEQESECSVVSLGLAKAVSQEDLSA